MVEETNVQDIQPEVIQEPISENVATDDVEALKERNAKLYARAKEAEEKYKALRVNQQEAANPPEDLRKTVEELKLAEAKRQFGFQHNLSPEETDAIFKVSKNPTKEVLEDPFVKGGLEAIRRGKRVDEATPSPGNKSPKIDGKSWAELKPEERAQNYSKLFNKG